MEKVNEKVVGVGLINGISIALVNSSINMKRGGFNLYYWLKDNKPSNMSLFKFWVNITYAATTEKSCKSRFSIN